MDRAIAVLKMMLSRVDLVTVAVCHLGDQIEDTTPKIVHLTNASSQRLLQAA